MFNIYRSNRAEWLAKLLSEELKLNPPNPFEAIDIIVNTWPTSRWLAEEIASSNGISAQINFPFPSSHLRKLVQLFLGLEVTKEDPWNTYKLAWTILDVLPSLLKFAEASQLNQWLANDNSNIEKLNKDKWDLACSIAKTLNTYFLYRPNTIISWWKLPKESNIAIRNLPKHMQWQPILLNLLKEKIESEPICIQIHHVLTLLKQQKAPQKELPKQLHVFGISTLAPIQIDLIKAISSIIEIKLFLLTPCQDLWQRCTNRREQLGTDWKNPMDEIWLRNAPRLESNLGRMGAEFQQLLEGSGEFQLSKVYEHDLFALPVQIAINTKRAPTLLEQLQQTLISKEKIHLISRASDDDSLVFIASPGQRRQIQLVRDQIIQWLAQDSALEARDIIVMTPQIERQAPLIASVFNDVSATNIHLPWKITDRTQLEKSGVIQFIMDMIEIAISELNREQLEQLITNKVIQETYQYTQEEIEKMIQCLNSTGFLWGLDDSDRHGDASHSLSWCLERWLMGLVLPSKPGLAPRGVAPFSRNYSFNEITKWWLILSKIRKHLLSLRKPRLCREWVVVLKNILNDFFSDFSHLSWECETFFSHLEEWEKIACNYELNIETSVLRDILMKSLSLESGRFGHRSGAITFSALEPMRAIPHKVIILMGLDESIFPRNENTINFSLMEHERLLGDPKSHDKDRYILLEAIMSSRDKLLVTWNCRDEKTGEELEAPGAIQQWIDFLKTELTKDMFAGLVRKPSPNPLANANFQSINNQPPISCDKRNLETRTWLNKDFELTTNSLVPQFNFLKGPMRKSQSITYEMAKSWLIDPQLVWLEKMGINPREKKQQLHMRELLHLEEFQRFLLLKDKLTNLQELNIDNKNQASWKEQLYGQGILPPKSATDIECEILDSRWKNLSLLVQELGKIEEKKLRFNNEVIDFLIIEKDIVVIEVGRLKIRSIMKAWLQHLQACAFGYKLNKTLLISRCSSNTKKNNYEVSLTFDLIQKDNANKTLKSLYSLVENGLLECWPIPPKSGWELAKAKYQNKKNPNNYFIRKWNGDFKLAGEKEEPEMIICFGENSSVQKFLENPIFEECFLKLYDPIFESLRFS